MRMYPSNPTSTGPDTYTLPADCTLGIYTVGRNIDVLVLIKF